LKIVFVVYKPGMNYEQFKCIYKEVERQIVEMNCESRIRNVFNIAILNDFLLELRGEHPNLYEIMKQEEVEVLDR
jgi:hypothetical protein